MRLLFATSSFAAYDGDPSAAAGLGVYQLVRELGKHIEGTVVTPAREDGGGEETLGGMRIRWIPPARPVAALHSSRDPRHLMRAYGVHRAMVRETARLAPSHDVAHGHWAFPAGYAVARLGIPSVCVCLGTDVHRYSRLPLFAGMFREVVTGTTVNIAMDPRAVSRIEEVSGRPARYVPNAVPLEDIPMGEEPDGAGIAWVGRMSPEKGPDVMIRAFADAVARDDRLTLTMMGDGPLMDDTRQLAATLGVADRVTFTGPVDNSEVLGAYRRSRMMVVSSRSEGLPAAALEALATGRPVVATAVGGLPEFLAPGGGITVPSEDHVALADAIVRAAARPWDPAFLRSQVERASVSAVVRTYLDIYREAIDRVGREGVAV